MNKQGKRRINISEYSRRSKLGKKHTVKAHPRYIKRKPIRRLIIKQGAIRVSDKAADELGEEMELHGARIASRAVKYAREDRRQTIKDRDIKKAAKDFHTTFHREVTLDQHVRLSPREEAMFQSMLKEAQRAPLQIQREVLQSSETLSRPLWKHYMASQHSGQPEYWYNVARDAMKRGDKAAARTALIMREQVMRTQKRLK